MKVHCLLIIMFLMLSVAMEGKPTVTQQPFGKMPDGTPVDIYTLNDGSVEARITNYGGIVVSLKVPDKAGHADDVILGFDSLDGFVENNNSKGGSFFDAIIGRYANRIANGTFVKANTAPPFC